MSLLSGRIPLVFQGEKNECGLACFCMILQFHGNFQELRALRHLAPGHQPLSLERLTQIAAEYGLSSRALRCEPGDLQKLQLPAIAHVDFDHFVVIARVSRQELTLLDPARGEVRQSLDTFSRRFTGIVLELIPMPAFHPAGKPPRHSPLKLIRQLPWHTLGRYLVSLLLLSLLIQLFALATPFYLQVIVDEVLLLNNLDMTIVVTLSFGAVYLISAGTRCLRGLVAIKLGAKLSYMMSAGLLRHLINLPGSFFRYRSIGDLVSRFGSLQPLQDFIGERLVNSFLDLLMLGTTLVMLSLYSSNIAIYVVVISVGYLGIQVMLNIPYRKHQHEQLMADAEAQSHFIETLQAIETIQRFEAAERRRGHWLNHLSMVLNAQVRAGSWALVMETGQYMFSGLLLLGVVYLAVQQVSLGILSIGMLYTMVTYANHFSGALVSLTAEWQGYMMLSLHVQRLSDITDETIVHRQPLDNRTPVNSITLDKLSFHYPGADHLFRNLNLTVSQHEKIAIVGLSGSGKSTLMALLRGEFQPVSGRILINRQPCTQNMNPTPVYSSLCQADCLLAGTVIDNITLMAAEPDMERVARVAQLVMLHDDILRLPLGYRELLSEQGSTLSAGQRQRLLIARTLYRSAGLPDGGVLLLDEATSHLDSDSEHALMQQLLALPGICFYITHRQEMAALADYIIRFEAGAGANITQTTNRRRQVAGT